MNCKKITLSLAAVLSLSSLNAYELKSVGFKATGMGGAGVASSRGSLATYYNPALIGISDYTSEISISVGVGLRENELMDTVDQLNALDLSTTLENIAENAAVNAISQNSSTTKRDGESTSKSDSTRIAEAQNILKGISSANGFQVTPAVSFGGQFSKYFAIGAYASSDVRAKLVVDSSKMDIIVKNDTTNTYFAYDSTTDTYSLSNKTAYEASSLEYALDNEDTYLSVSAMTSVEVPVSFAYPLEQKHGTISFGITLKPMSVETTYSNMAVDSESDTITDDLDDNTKTYSAVGVDLGIAYKNQKTDLTVALVGKNINKPSFETEADANGNIEKFEMDSFFRAGMSLPVWNDNIEFAIDADLQESDTSYEGMKSQYIGGGMEFHPASWFALRAGAMQNIASESIDEGMIYTAGVGFGLKWLQVDVSAQVAQETGTYDGEEIPKYANVNLSLISRWGDGYNKKVAPVSNEMNTESKEKITPFEQEKIDKIEKERIEKKAEKAHAELDKSI